MRERAHLRRRLDRRRGHGSSEKHQSGRTNTCPLLCCPTPSQPRLRGALTPFTPPHPTPPHLARGYAALPHPALPHLTIFRTPCKPDSVRGRQRPAEQRRAPFLCCPAPHKLEGYTHHHTYKTYLACHRRPKHRAPQSATTATPFILNPWPQSASPFDKGFRNNRRKLLSELVPGLDRAREGA